MATQLSLFNDDNTQTQELPRTFTQAQKLLDEIDCINAGGCGIAALALYRWRKAHGLKVSGFTFLSDDICETRHNRRCLKENDLDSLKVPSHVALRVGTRLYDSNGSNAKYTCYGIEGIQHGITESILLHLINNIDGWNRLFDREESVPEIERLLGVDLSDVTYYPG